MAANVQVEARQTLGHAVNVNYFTVSEDYEEHWG